MSKAATRLRNKSVSWWNCWLATELRPRSLSRFKSNSELKYRVNRLKHTIRRRLVGATGARNGATYFLPRNEYVHKLENIGISQPVYRIEKLQAGAEDFV